MAQRFPFALNAWPPAPTVDTSSEAPIGSERPTRGAPNAPGCAGWPEGLYQTGLDAEEAGRRAGEGEVLTVAGCLTSTLATFTIAWLALDRQASSRCGQGSALTPSNPWKAQLNTNAWI